MRTALPALLIGLTVGTPSVAQPRVSTSRMTCAEVIDTIKRDGQARIPTVEGSERLVRDRSFCEIFEIAELRFLATRDNPQCPAGYRCRQPDYEDWNWD